MTVQECIDFNRQHFFENYGEHSGDYKLFVVAIDLRHQKALIGGYGALGVGQMWRDVITLPSVPLPGWEEAPTAEYPGVDMDVTENMNREFDMIRQRDRWLISQN